MSDLKSRAVRADEKAVTLIGLRETAEREVADGRWRAARAAVDRIISLQEEIATLRKYETDESYRQALVLRLENGYH